MLAKFRHRSILLITCMACLVMLPSIVFSASVGQIKGILKGENGDPVIGASVQIIGTSRGAITDFDGKYVIGQVEPGTYSLKITHLDFKEVEITDVIVNADLTSEQNHVMEKKVTALDDKVVVVATRDVIDKFEVSNQTIMSKEQIEVQPVTTVDELLSQVAGVVTSRDGDIFIRGGRAGEVSYIVDGVQIGDPLGGLGQVGANLSLTSGSIQEFTVIKDGFDPEYGNAVSGIIKVTTQTGSKDNTRLSMQFRTDDFGNNDLNKYSRNNDFVQVKLSGPDPFLRSKLLPSLGLNFLQDKELTYFLFAEVDKDDGIHQYNRFSSPTTRRQYGAFNVFGLDVPERLNNRYYWMANFKFRPIQSLKLIFGYKQNEIHRTLFSWQYRYSPNTAPIQEIKWRVASIEVSQSIAKNMNYEAIFSMSTNSLIQKPGDPENPGRGLDPDESRFSSEWESWADQNQNGVYDMPEPVFNIYPDTGNFGTDYSGSEYTFGEFNYDDSAYLRDENHQSGRAGAREFRFNDNLIVDLLEGEAFVDLNGNGVWDRGDPLYDKNGNQILDWERLNNINQHVEEPYVDGDSIIGEPFYDLNWNDVFDYGIDYQDLNTQDLNVNGMYDGPGSIWEPGIPFVDRNGNGYYDFPNERYDEGEEYTDVNGNGVHDLGGSSNFLVPGSRDEAALWHDSKTDTYAGEVKVFWQLGNHELKGGCAIKKWVFDFQEIQKPYEPYLGRYDGGPFSDRGSFRDMFSYQPWGGHVYFRDKIEYGSMIASLGFRWDFFVQDAERLIPAAEQNDMATGVIYGDRHKISPRIGFSYPISDKAKVHFNYGHFYQRPPFDQFYASNTASVNSGAIVGNYNLDYIKTVQYSFGVKYAMTENYSVDISGYFKDEFDKVNSRETRVGTTGLKGNMYQNSDYGRSRGFEMTVEKRGGSYVNGYVSYVYAFAYGKESQTNTDYFEAFELSREPLSEAPLDHDVRHRLSGSLQLFVPGTVKPRLFGLPIPNDWSLGLITEIRSGMPFTPDAKYPGISGASGEDIQRNSMRQPSIVNFNIRFAKAFELLTMDLDFILEVENVFDSRNVEDVYAETGRPDAQETQGNIVLGGTEYDKNPANWDYGRQIELGLQVNL